MDACHHYGQKQEGACQLHDPHKTEQEILAGNERERDGFFFLLFSLKTVPLSCPVQTPPPKTVERAEEASGMHIK